MNAAAETKLKEVSRDCEVSDLLDTVDEFVGSCECDAYYIGSIALMAHLPTPHRIPSDVDVVVSRADAEGFVEQFAGHGFSVTEVPGFIEATNGKKKVHCVVEGLHMLTSDRTATLDIVDLQLDPNSLLRRSIDFPLGSSFQVLVPLPEIVLSTLLLRPVDCGVVHDTVLLTSSIDFHPDVLLQFLITRPTALELVRCRLQQVCEIVEAHAPSWNRILDCQTALATMTGANKALDTKT